MYWIPVALNLNPKILNLNLEGLNKQFSNDAARILV